MIWFCIFNLGCVTSQSLQYGGIHDSHFKYIQTTITSLFLGRFWKHVHQNKHFTPRYTFYTYIRLEDCFIKPSPEPPVI